jgi:hypothetical protein
VRAARRPRLQGCRWRGPVPAGHRELRELYGQHTADTGQQFLPEAVERAVELREFAAFWRQHAEVLTSGTVYHEVAPQLVLMGYRQRIVNGGGHVEREYGIGRGRIDLLVSRPYQAPDGKRACQREALEQAGERLAAEHACVAGSRDAARASQGGRRARRT